MFYNSNFTGTYTNFTEMVLSYTFFTIESSKITVIRAFVFAFLLDSFSLSLLKSELDNCLDYDCFRLDNCLDHDCFRLDNCLDHDCFRLDNYLDDCFLRCRRAKFQEGLVNKNLWFFFFFIFDDFRV